MDQLENEWPESMDNSFLYPLFGDSLNHNFRFRALVSEQIVRGTQHCSFTTDS